MTDKDHCIYTKISKDKYVILSLYVNDILIAGSDIQYVKKTKERLSSKFRAYCSQLFTILMK